jgi:hypothetical protein
MIWFCPNLGAVDTLQLFERSDLFPKALATIDVYKFYAQHLMAGIEPGADAPNWGLVGPNTYPEFVRVDAFRDIVNAGKKTAIEIGAVKPGSCDALYSAELAIRCIRRVHEAGGRVDYLAIDSPLTHGIWDCAMTSYQTALVTVKYIKHVLEVFPNVTFGIIDAYPSFTSYEILLFVQQMNDYGYHPRFLHIDTDRNALRASRTRWERFFNRPGILERTFPAEMQKIASACKIAPIPYGQVLWGQNFRDRMEYRNSVMAFVQMLRDTVRPDDLIVQSFAEAVGTTVKDLPDNLPESDILSHTAIVNDAVTMLT